MNKIKSIGVFSIFLIIISLIVFLFAVFSKSKVKTEVPNSVVLGKAVLEPQEENPTTVSEVISEVIKEEQKKEVPSNITAKSYIVYDAVLDKVVAEKNSDLALPPASTTKIMTALVALEEYSLKQVLDVPKECIDLPGTNAYLQFSDKLTVESLLYALLLPSASDAACVLARGGNQYEFLAKMNEKAENIGLKHTNFENVIGLDSDEDNHFSSASDLLIMAKEAMKNREFMKIVGTKIYPIRSFSTNQIYEVRNTNEFLSTVPGTVGIKTGYTDKAGGCLVYAYDNRGKSVIIVIMGSKEGSRFIDTKALLDWYLEL